jgi:hypothetical protein
MIDAGKAVRRRPAVSALAFGAAMAAVVMAFMTTLPPSSRLFMALIFGSGLAFTSYANWRDGAAGSRSAVRKAALIAGSTIGVSTAALLVPLL